ncbi:MAG: hypothetical protein ABIJ80_00840, partial [Patescibacteria group bacterium]
LKNEALYLELKGLIQRIKDISYRVSKLESNHPTDFLTDEQRLIMVEFYSYQLKHAHQIVKSYEDLIKEGK